MRPDRSVLRKHLDEQLAGVQPKAWDRPRYGWLRAIREALGMPAVELATRVGITDTRVSQIERAEVEGSLRMSTMVRLAAALESRFVYLVLPDRSLEDLVLRQAYHQALVELSLPASVAADGTLDPETEEMLEVRTLELVDTMGLWRQRRAPDPSPQ